MQCSFLTLIHDVEQQGCQSVSIYSVMLCLVHPVWSREASGGVSGDDSVVQESRGVETTEGPTSSVASPT